MTDTDTALNEIVEAHPYTPVVRARTEAMREAQLEATRDTGE
jgi:hypothetical protein